MLTTAEQHLLSIDLIYGPLFYLWLLVTCEKLDEHFIEVLINYAFEGIKSRENLEVL